MALTVGTRLGHYDVTALLGEGGMGQVYRATDTQLHRDVALKTLPDAFADDADRLARFEREAHVLASLNHPNIAQIHGIEQSGDTRALVLELVEGPTLADRIAQGAIPLDEALPIARQIAEALEAAHEAGVIHRDLKPANIKVREDGTVKVLDFGLAKALSGDVQDVDLSQSPTVTAAGTLEGVILGTAAYMSPEQARGKPLDKRTDIWSFGCVLYEVLTGRLVFGGDTLSDTIANILDREPQWEALTARTPTAIRRLLLRCLDKDPKDRLHDVADARLEIEEAISTSGAETTEFVSGPPVPVWQRSVTLAVAVVASLAVGGIVVWAFLGNVAQPSPTPKRFILPLAESDPLLRTLGAELALSPDGQALVYRATRDGTGHLFRRPLDQFEATPIPGTEGGQSPFFSPDGRWVGFVADGALRKVALAGGPAQTLAPAAGGGISPGDWGADDMIVFGTGQALMQISADGRDLTPLFTPDDQRRVSYPQILPGGEAVLFTLAPAQENTGELHVVMSETGEHRTLVPNAAKGRVLDSSHLVFFRGGSLWAVPFDEERLDVVGSPVPVLDGVRAVAGGNIQYAVADEGTLAYLPDDVAPGDNTLIFMDRQGTVAEVTVLRENYLHPRFSPDGTRLAVQIGTDDDSNIFIYEMSSGRLRQLTFDGGEVPLWTPDGTRVTFLADGALLNITADFSGETQHLYDAAEELGIAGPSSWFPTGRVLFAYGSFNITELTQSEQGDMHHRPLLVETSGEEDLSFSKDGNWFSYQSRETGASEVFIQPYPVVSRAQRKITQGGGNDPVWSQSGELFYHNGGQLWTVPITTEPTLAWEIPVPLFATPAVTNAGAFVNYDVAPDGQRFVFVRPLAEENQPNQINVVLNWFQELTERVPVP